MDFGPGSARQCGLDGSVSRRKMSSSPTSEASAAFWDEGGDARGHKQVTGGSGTDELKVSLLVVGL